MPLGSCGDDKRLWPGEGVVDHEGIATALKEIGFDGVCTIEEFRPEYYAMSHEENIKKAAEVTKAFVNKYFWLKYNKRRLSIDKPSFIHTKILVINLLKIYYIFYL